METLFDHEKAEIRYNEETNAIELIWKKFQDEESYKLLMTKCAEFLEQKKAEAWLSDIRKEGVVGPKSSQWLKEVISPRTEKAGLKRIAVVMDADIFKQVYVDGIKKNNKEQSDNMQFFTATDSANEWLISEKNK